MSAVQIWPTFDVELFGDEHVRLLVNRIGSFSQKEVVIHVEGKIARSYPQSRVS